MGCLFRSYCSWVEVAPSADRLQYLLCIGEQDRGKAEDDEAGPCSHQHQVYAALQAQHLGDARQLLGRRRILQ